MIWGRLGGYAGWSCSLCSVFLAFRYHQQVHIACSGTCQSIDHLDHLIHMHVHVLYASVGIDWPELFSINVVHIQL